ncbi:MAG TPA: lysozyme inhibitor LprI family protein [Terriglobales bacterium]|nr:lysozyme inhibitor LprI family protein [Terriglobales bacterium]
MYRLLCATAIAAVFVTLSPKAHAASFDCGKAGTDFEKAICVNSGLSDLDGQLSTKYNDALKKLSPDGQSTLRDGEKEWLHFVRAVCLARPVGEGRTDCLQLKYSDRLSALDAAALQIGGYTFSRIDHYASQPASLDKSEDHRPFETQVSYPYIDNAKTPEAKGFNQAALDLSHKKIDSNGYCDSSPADISTDFRIEPVGSSLVIIERNLTWYCHGSPHGDANPPERHSYLLSPTFHELATNDIFAADKPWQDALTDGILGVISQQTTDMSPKPNVDREEIKQLVVDPKNWQLSAEGISMSMPTGDWFGPFGSRTDILVKWEDLRPVLAAHAPILN